MTVRRYYDDATTATFTAAVVDRPLHEGHPAVVLDQTYFYPSSGGQPHDTGQISDGRTTVTVVGVIAAAPDMPVIHVLDRHWDGDERVAASIDWPRRFDHMQQHTGQHVLSQAFLRVAEAETVGFHLSAQTVTIDLNSVTINDVQLDHVEQLANDVIWANAPIVISQASPEEAAKLSLRKLPTKHDGKIRLVAIGDFDLTACGGTHMSAAGQVGLIKIIKTERRGDLTRVEFRCGGRALEDYRRKNAVLVDLTGKLTTGQDDLVGAVARQQEDARHWRSMAIALEKELSKIEADRLVAQVLPVDGVRIVITTHQNRAPESTRQIVSLLTENPGTIALMGLVSPDRTHLVFGRAPDAPGHMGDLLRETNTWLTGAKGGGSATLAQGSGAVMEAAELELVLERAAEQLRSTIKTVE